MGMKGIKGILPEISQPSVLPFTEVYATPSTPQNNLTENGNNCGNVGMPYGYFTFFSFELVFPE
jgi:hypothetical protein